MADPIGGAAQKGLGTRATDAGRRRLRSVLDRLIRLGASDRGFRRWLFDRALQNFAPDVGWKELRETLLARDIEGFPVVPGNHYVADFYGPSAHKLPDIRQMPGFGPLAEEAVSSGRTLLYYDRLFTLYNAMGSVARAGEAAGAPLRVAEVGVYRGGTTRFLAACARALGRDASLDAFDTFTGHAAEDVEPSRDDRHQPGKFKSTAVETVREYLKDLPEVTIHPGRFQDRCSAIADREFSLVHLDVDLYAPTRFALDFFDARLVRGGIIVIDDFRVASCPGVEQAVDEFLESHPGYASIPLMTGQCMLVRLSSPGG